MKKILYTIVFTFLAVIHIVCGINILSDGSSNDTECKTVTGYAFYENGNKVVGARVICCSDNYLSLSDSSFVYIQTVTDNNGRFELQDTMHKNYEKFPYGNYIILINDDKKRLGDLITFSFDNLLQGSNSDTNNFQLPQSGELRDKTGSIKGVVKKEAGTVSGSIVQIFGTDKMVVTDENGAYVLDNLPKGIYNLRFSNDSSGSVFIDYDNVSVDNNKVKDLDTVDVGGLVKLMLVSNYEITQGKLFGSDYYPSGKEITISADSTHAGFNFVEWCVLGDNYPTFLDTTTSIIMNVILHANTIIEAKYIDIEPPYQPSDLDIYNIGLTYADVVWSKTTDNDSVSHYCLVLALDTNNILDTIDSIYDTTWHLDSLIPNKLYYVGIWAYDISGNYNKYIFKHFRTEKYDTIAPTSPSFLHFDSVNATIISISWGISTDNIGVDEYQLWYSQTNTSDTIRNTFSADVYSHRVKYLFPGAVYTVGIRARDKAGNISNWAFGYITTLQQNDTLAPSVPTNIRVYDYNNSYIALKWDDTIAKTSDRPDTIP